MKLLILDRDGVINEDSDAYIKSPDEWHALPGALEAIARLSAAGYRIAVATNQSGVGRGLFDLETLAAINAKMQGEVHAAGGRIDAVFFCPHAPDANCECRKPRPGMVFEILRRFDVEPAEACFIGDSLRDLQAGHAAGCRTILLLTGKGRQTMQDGDLPPGTTVRVDLAGVAAELAP
ncbi:MAG: D-glycero-beta-D-manno-heptose 1,7-bisphosphate 7-phosphatase [Burkholderiaceae bacterium]|nr:D-glycero-beta-D-manno-heptose 1,7-bisphosphate 7-phosphatase [Burkholderiaceae bacterium]